ncbi:hypothetical protein Purlil1_7800 [Purpureocillium lilacinum]|uniref:Uncharacterized protein n=1 Tax=Purpureocillium lilacinum TaxID=33203 RepID=A0ABR0BVQ3_PURLI|nr:hypothetical protein Purlil1_7800 [Purpureocillium lilacinum]
MASLERTRKSDSVASNRVGHTGRLDPVLFEFRSRYGIALPAETISPQTVSISPGTGSTARLAQANRIVGHDHRASRSCTFELILFTACDLAAAPDAGSSPASQDSFVTFKAASITNLQQWLSTDENRLVARVNWSCARSGGQPFSDPLPPFSPSPSSASLPTPTRKTRRPHLHNIDCTAIQCIFVDVGTTAKPLSSMLGAKYADNHACNLQHHRFKTIPSMCIVFHHFPSPWLAQHRSRRPPPSQVPAASRRTTEGSTCTCPRCFAVSASFDRPVYAKGGQANKAILEVPAFRCLTAFLVADAWPDLGSFPGCQISSELPSRNVEESEPSDRQLSPLPSRVAMPCTRSAGAKKSPPFRDRVYSTVLLTEIASQCDALFLPHVQDLARRACRRVSSAYDPSAGSSPLIGTSAEDLETLLLILQYKSDRWTVS